MTRWNSVATALVVLMCAALNVSCERGGSERDEPATNANAVGVRACDDYLAKYTRCASERAPYSAREQMLANASAMRASWKRAAAVPVSKRGLEQGCQAALKAGESAMRPYGCTW